MIKPNREYEFGTFRERLDHFCALFDVAPPEIVYERGEPIFTDPLAKWVHETNANMDWLFCGSPCAMLREWANSRSRKRNMAEINQQLEPEVRAGLFALLIAVVENKLPIEEPLQVFGKVVEDWRAANSA